MTCSHPGRSLYFLEGRVCWNTKVRKKGREKGTEKEVTSEVAHWALGESATSLCPLPCLIDYKDLQTKSAKQKRELAKNHS